MILRQAASVALMGLVAGVLAFVAIGVLQPPPVLEHTQSLEFGVGLLALALVAAMTGWGISGGAPWGRFLGSLVAIACAIAGLFGIYGLAVLLANPELWSRANLAVAAVLLLTGIAFVVLLIALLAGMHSGRNLIGPRPRQRLTWAGVRFREWNRGLSGFQFSAVGGGGASMLPRSD